MKPETDNPVLDLGKKLGSSNIELKLHRQLMASHTVIFFMAIALLVLVCSNVYFAVARQPVNHIVEIDERNRVHYGGAMDAKKLDVDRVMPGQIVDFIDNWRTVTGDNTVQKLYAQRLYCKMADGSNAVSRMNDYFKERENNPFELNKKLSRTIAMRNILQQSEQTWFVEWDETTRNHNGDVLTTGERFKAQMIIYEGDVRDGCRERNPLGIYMTDINWSKVL